MGLKNRNEDSGIAGVILCAGNSARMNNLDKSTLLFDGQPVFTKSLESFKKSKIVSKIILVASKDNFQAIKEIVSELDYDADVIIGGEKRQDSVSNAINYLKNSKINKIIIHDSARPFFDESILNKGIKLLDNYDAVIPAIPIQDTIKKVENDLVHETIDRNKLFRSQTPQFFNFKKLFMCIEKTSKNKIYTDEAELFELNNFDVYCIPGDIGNEKITTESDLNFLQQHYSNIAYFKTGFASDVHKLVKNNKLILGGVLIPFEKGLAGNSDADVVLHAITDSIFGAIGKGDMGKYFPSNEAKWKNASSSIFLFKALELMHQLRLEIYHIDIQIILQEPKISGLLKKIEQSLSNLLNLGIEKINLKATSTDNIGLIGSGDAIGTLCAITLTKSYDRNL